MPRRVHVDRGTDGFDLVEVPAPSEDSLQQVLLANPQLLPADDLGFDGDLLVLGRETGLASGYIDLLCLARTGDLVLVEFKTGPANPDFRHALAQLIDYGAQLWQLNREDFDRGVVQRFLAGRHVPPAFQGCSGLADLLTRSTWDLIDEQAAALEDRLTEVLATGDFRFVVAAQRFTPTMFAAADYLNTTLRYGRVYLVEVIRLTGADISAHAAAVVRGPLSSANTGPAAAQTRTTEQQFLERVDDPAYRDALADLFATCRSLQLQLNWGTKGLSIRTPVLERSEPVSIAWVFLDNDGWANARHVTLGVDLATLEQTPSIEAAVRRYLVGAAELPGATPVGGKGPAGSVLPPVAFVVVKDGALRLVETLVQDIAGKESST